MLWYTTHTIIGVSIVTGDKLIQDVPCNFHPKPTLNMDLKWIITTGIKEQALKNLTVPTVHRYPSLESAGRWGGIFRPPLRDPCHVMMIACRYWATG